jgi:putative sterol carrier protein
MPSLPIEQTLAAFQNQVNGHKSLKNLLKGWEPTIIIEATDSGHVFSLPVRNQKIEAVQEARLADSHEILVRGTEQLLEEVFSGKTNPAMAHLNGTLEVFGSDRDQVKLDSISLVLWGF